MRKDKSVKSIIYKLIENASIQILNLIVGIILARVLSPSDYGVYSILLIFINIAQAVVVAGLNSALIQRSDIDEDDYNTVFTVSVAAATVIYFILFVFAPLIAKIYNSESVIIPLRVISILLFPQALYSVANARIARKMEFPLMAKISVVSVIVSGSVSIVMAMSSAGIWALVVQQILTYSLSPLIYCIKTGWFPKLKLKIDRLKVLLGFGSKVLLSDLINSIYYNIQSMIIGIKFNTDSLGFFNKGQMFPRTIMQVVSGSVETVMFPVYSDMQDDKKSMVTTIIDNIKVISFLVFPMMIGLFAVANEIIELLLTEKWLDCAIIIQISCVAYMFWPIDSINLQALKACGVGNAYFKVSFFKKCIASVVLFVFVFFSHSLEIFAFSAILIYVSDVIVGGRALKKYIGISVVSELIAIWRSAICSSCILIVMLIPKLAENVLLTLLCKMVCGVLIYALSSCILNRNTIKTLVSKIMNYVHPKILDKSE